MPVPVEDTLQYFVDKPPTYTMRVLIDRQALHETEIFFRFETFPCFLVSRRAWVTKDLATAYCDSDFEAGINL